MMAWITIGLFDDVLNSPPYVVLLALFVGGTVIRPRGFPPWRRRPRPLR